MRKTWKRALSYVLSAAMVLTAGAFGADKTTAKAADTYTAKLTADSSKTNSSFAEWGEFAPDTKFELGKEATISWTADGDKVGALNGMVVCIDTDLTMTDDIKAKVTSVKFDDVEALGVDYSKIAFGVENDSKTTARITMRNKYGDHGDGIFPANYEFPKFKKLDISFIIAKGDIPDTPADPTTAPGGDDKPATDKWCTATVAGEWGTIWGWGESKPEQPATGDVWQCDIDHYGDYTLTVTAPIDTEKDKGCFAVYIDLATLPANYTFVGKTVKVNDKEYDWSAAKLYKDDQPRICVWHEWADETKPYANPIKDDMQINAGDKIELTFSVVEQKPLFTANFESWGGFWGWDASTPATPGEWSVAVLDDTRADYTLKLEAPSDVEYTGAFDVGTTLTTLPTDYTLVGKTFKINDKEYDWSKGKLYNDNGSIRIGIWNAFAADDTNGNPIPELVDKVVINAGDKIEATFSLVDPIKDEPTPPGPVNPTPQPTTKTLGTAKGKTFTSGNFKYKVTTAATITGTKKTTGKVTVTGLSAAGKKKTSINVKNKVSVKSTGASYSVTGIGKAAFKNAKKLKTATLGTNIKSIPASAFAGCKKLSKLSVKKAISVKKGAFKGCKKTIKVTGGSKKVNKANVKKLKKSGYKKFK